MLIIRTLRAGSQVPQIEQFPDKQLSEEKQENPEQTDACGADNSSLIGHQNPNANPSNNQTRHSREAITRFFHNIQDLWGSHKRKQLFTDPRAWLEFVALIVLVFYTNYTRLTLNEIRSGGSDTHALAVAAGKQATQTEELAKRMKDQAEKTKTIAEQAVVQAQAAQSAAATASNTLRQMKMSFITEQRPYVIIDTPVFVRNPAVDGQPIEVNVAFKNLAADSGASRTPFRAEAEQDSGLIPNTIPG